MSSEGRELAELALQLGREAGELLLDGWRNVSAVATKSSQHDLVTQMDGASETLIRQRLAAARSDDAVVGEEEGSGGGSGEGGYRWIVDPLDGTVNYFYGQPSWAVSIAVQHHGRTVAGAVVAPALREEYLAVAGGGAWSIEGPARRRLHRDGPRQMADALVATGFGYRPERRAAQGRVVAQILPQVRDIRRGGAAAVDLCWAAAGKVDAYYERGLHVWDWAAGALVAAEAGLVVSGARGEPVSGELLVAAPPAMFPEFSRELVRLAADTDAL